MTNPPSYALRPSHSPRWPAALVWGLSWVCLVVLDPSWELANLAMVLVLASAASAVWLSAFESVLVSTAAVVVFNWQFVPPRGTLRVGVHQHLLLLLTMLAVSTMVALLMARQRRLAQQAQTWARRVEIFQGFNDALRDVDAPAEQARLLQDVLSRMTGSGACVVLCPDGQVPHTQALNAVRLGEANADEEARLWQCVHDGNAFGPGTGASEGQDAIYLPVRGKRAVYGAVLLHTDTQPSGALEETVAATQTLCDHMGLSLERTASARKATDARDEAQSQKLRNTLLAAISHDYRTPLATILGAASALREQGDRLSTAQRSRFAQVIVDEVGQLSQLTDNTLQLARLDASGVKPKRDWESAEEIIGSVVHRVRRNNPDVRVSLRVEPDLPLLRCDAVLLVQLMNNLVDNAIRYAGNTSALEIQARRVGADIMLSVGDRGPGVPLAWRDRIFDAFQRGEFHAPLPPAADARGRRGAGIGLAVCRAIATAHGGVLRVRSRKRGGASFECLLPIEPQPLGSEATGLAP